MDQNPYAPPKTRVSDLAPGDGRPVASEVPLYSPNQIAVATFLASALAGAWLMAANFRATGQPHKTRNSWWIGLAVTLATFAVGFVLPDKFPNVVLPLGVAFGIRALAERHFTVILAEHEKAGGELRSWWRVIGICLLVLAILFGVGFVGVLGYYFIEGFAAG